MGKSWGKRDVGVDEKMEVKLNKYVSAEVREYWIVDPEKERVIVYGIDNDIDISMYSFDNQVPVRIFNQECKIDFRDIAEYIADIPKE